MSPSAPRLGLRLSLAYAAVFLWAGIYLPYWPVWLEHRGMSPAQVGILLGAAPWIRVIVSPLAGRWADRTGRPHRLVQACAVLLVGSSVGFAFAHGFVPLLLLMVAAGMFFAPIVPLTDGLTLGAEAEGRLSYGRVRLWGSAAFILASWLGGELLELHGEAVILWLSIGAAALIVLASGGLPSGLPSPGRIASDGVSTVPADPVPAVPAGASTFSLTSRAFVFVLGTAALLQLSHAVLYAFGTQHWRAEGLDEGTVGLLWAESVLAEIALFAAAPRLEPWLTSRRLWLAAGLAGTIRWTVLGSTSALPWLVLVQALHGLTFGAMHLGSMRYLRRYVPAHARSRATTLYSAAAAGLAFGIGLPLAGVLYGWVGGQAYLVMAGCSLLGTILVLLMFRPGRTSAK